MRKQFLQRLVFQNDNLRSKIVSEFLQSEPISLLNDDDSISFQDFVCYLNENLPFFNPNLEQKEFFQRKSDSELFNLFLRMPLNNAAEKLQEKREKSHKMIEFNPGSILRLMPLDVMETVLSPQLSASDTAKLSATCQTLYSVTKDVGYWQDKFIAAGCNPPLLAQVIETHAIHNYRNLYRAFIRQSYQARVRMSYVWELLGLSSDARAITYAINKEKVSAETKNRYGETLAHYAALSGSASAIDRSLQMKDAKGQTINPLAKTTGGLTIAHYAAWSGSENAIDKSLQVKDAKGQTIDPLAKATEGETIAHYAALSGSASAIEKSLQVKNAESQTIDPLTKTSTGLTLAHYAAWSGSASAIEKSLQVQNAKGQSIDPLAKSIRGETLAHCAAWSGSASAIEKSLQVQNAKGQSIDPLAKSFGDQTIAHYAAYSGSASAIEKSLQVKNAKGQTIDPLAKTTKGLTLAHYAAWSGSISAIDKSLRVKDAKGQTIDPLAKTTNGLTLAHYAAWSGSVSAIDKSLQVKDAKGQAINPLEKTTTGETLTHYAAKSGSADAVIFMRLLSYDLALKELDPTVPDMNGHNAFWHADQSNNSVAVKAALSVPITTLLQQRQPRLEMTHKQPLNVAFHR